MSTISDSLGLMQDPEGSLQPSVPINANADQTAKLMAGNYTRDIAGDANYTLVAADYQTGTLTLTSSVLTAGRDVIFPAYFAPILVINNTGQTLTLKKSGQTGVALADGATVRAYCGPDDVMTASGGGVDSVNGATGAVTLDASDIGIADAGNHFTATDVEGALQELGALRTPKITSTVTSNTITPAGDTDLVRPSASLAAGLTIANPTAAPADGAGFVVDLIDNGTSRALTWGSKYATRMATLPTATTAGKRHRIGFEYNLADDKLYCMYAQVAP